MIIFHQNMRVYSRNEARATEYQDRMRRVRNGIPGQTQALPNVSVMGFTEIMGRGTVVLDNLRSIASELNPPLGNNLLLVEAGQTALSKRPEYIGIAWDSAAFALSAAGHVTRHKVQWIANSSPSYQFQHIDVISTPSTAMSDPDTRGLAFVVGNGGVLGGAPRHMLIGFMHNMYTFKEARTNAYDNIPLMVSRAFDSLAVPIANAEIVIGGDFNLAPRRPRAPRAQRPLFPAYALDPRNRPQPTTLRHCYDYWMTDQQHIPAGNLSVHYITRRSTHHASDHAGISIDF